MGSSPPVHERTRILCNSLCAGRPRAGNRCSDHPPFSTPRANRINTAFGKSGSSFRNSAAAAHKDLQQGALSSNVMLTVTPNQPQVHDSADRPSHPPGIYTLFFTEMWERLSYYGMRALLVLFMVDAVQKGGLGLTDKSATAIYGIYTALVYLSALPGGWIGDRLLGAKRSVWWGGVVIAVGHGVLALPGDPAFFLGLLLVALGSGLLKSNMSALVGQLYPEGGARRDAGFTLFYMGINIGAFIGPLVCSGLGENIGWRWGFSAAAVGMVLGLVQFKLTERHLAGVGDYTPHPSHNLHRDWAILGAGTLLLAIVAGLCMAGVISIDPVWLAERSAVVIVAIAIWFFTRTLVFGGLTGEEKKRVFVILILFLSSALFWAGFEQVGSSFTLFAERFTIRQFGSWEMPAGWFQSFNALFVISLAPVVGAFWIWLAKRNASPPLATKFAWGLLMLAVGFLIAAFAAKRALATGAVWPTWLITIYLLHTIGELFLSPVGLSSVTKLSPSRLTGQMMGIWFLGTALGNLFAGLLAGNVTGDDSSMIPLRFLQVVATAGGAGVLLWLCARPIQRLIPGIR